MSETLNYVQRKADGLYFSVDGDFIQNKSKAFVFHEGAAMGIGDFLTDEYNIVPLTPEEVAEFEARFDEDPIETAWELDCQEAAHDQD